MPSITPILSVIKTQDGLANISSTNISNAERDGYVAKHAQVISLGCQGGLSGVTLSPIYNAIDPTIQLQTRKENSTLSQNQVIQKFYEDISVMFGAKGTQSSFAHDLGRFITTVDGITANPDLSKKTEAMSFARSFAANISGVANKINDLRSSCDKMLDEAVKEVNGLMKRITTFNETIAQLSIDKNQSSPAMPGYIDVTSLENDRAELVHQLAGFIDIDVFKTPNNTLTITTTGSGRTLVKGPYNYQLDYTPSVVVVPGQALSPITTDIGVDITAEINNGQLGGLLRMRDQDLVKAQSEFDELTRVIRDTVNALHNQGAALMGGSTLKGTMSLPGLANAPFDGNTQISGTGTVRLGVIDNQGTIIDYKDVPLTNGMTITTLMNAVGAQNYEISNGAVATVGGTITFTQLASGEMQLQSTDGHTIVIGGVGGIQPMISLGNAYDPTTGLGFSHFFGLNNLFQTGTDLASSASQVGIANQLSIRPDLLVNSSHLAVGTLSDTTPIPTLPGGALGNRKTDIAQAIAHQLSRGNLQFLPAGDVQGIVIDAQNYSTQLMSLLQNKANQAKYDLKSSQTTYNQVTALAADKSSVKVSEELIKMYNTNTSRQVATQALKYIFEMREAILRIA